MRRKEGQKNVEAFLRRLNERARGDDLVFPFWSFEMLAVMVALDCSLVACKKKKIFDDSQRRLARARAYRRHSRRRSRCRDVRSRRLE